LSSSDKRLAAMLELAQQVSEIDESTLLERGLRAAVALSGSAAGFIALAGDHDEKAARIICSFGSPCASAIGVCDRQSQCCLAAECVEALRFGTPVIRGNGTMPTMRRLVVPVIEEGKVRLALGVAERDADFSLFDAHELQLVGRRQET
jgi:hypothetical protein